MAAWAETDIPSADVAIDVPEGCELVEAPFGGVLWSWAIGEGAEITSGDTVAVIEAMKMESPVQSPISGKVRKIYVSERQPISPGSPLFAVEAA